MYTVYETPKALLLEQTPPFIVKGDHHVVARTWTLPQAETLAAFFNTEAKH